MAKAVNKLIKITINSNELTTDQIIRILRSCTEKTYLKGLRIRNTNLSDIDAELIGKALNKLEEIGLDGCSLKANQLNYLLELSAGEETQIKTLNIKNEDLRNID